MRIDPKKCVACGNCVAVCPMGAIYIDPVINRAVINADECVECYSCHRGMSMEHLNPTLVRMLRGALAAVRLRFDPEPDVCPTAAITPDELEWPRTVRRAFSDVIATHESTGIHGRGTEEVKTNDVTNRVAVGTVGLTVELGRPGIGARFTDVEKVTRALVTHPVRFEEHNPVTSLMVDRAAGTLNPEILDEKVMSCIIEVAMDEADLATVLEGLREVSREIDTVMALGVAVRCADDGTTQIERVLEAHRYQPIWAKTNVGLGRPDPAQVDERRHETRRPEAEAEHQEARA
jgi:ferredoxin